MATKSTDLSLAGLGLDKPMLLEAARVLLADIFWDEEQEGEYKGHERQLMDRPETPQVPDEIDALMKMSHICGRIEQAWGESFYSVSRRMVGPNMPENIRAEVQAELVHYAFMGCMGHGVGCQDMKGFPDDLDPSPINIENPMQDQLYLLGCSS